MYAFISHLKVKQGSADTVQRALLALVEPSRAEPGCLVYLPHVVDAENGEFMVYERYRDEAAFQAHRGSEHYERWVGQDIAPNLEDRNRVECDPLEPGGS